MNLTTIEKLAEAVPHYRDKLRQQIQSIIDYPEDGYYLSEELVPILAILIDLEHRNLHKDLVDQAWCDIFKSTVKFNRPYITKNLDAGNEKFMKYLDSAIHLANPEHQYQVGLGNRKRRKS